MNRRWSLAASCLAAVFSLAATGATSADNADPANLSRMTQGYTYFNRPGATPQQHDADVRDCAMAAGRMHSVNEFIAAQPLSPVRYPYVDKADRNLAAASLENCMVVRGWRVVLIPEAEGKALMQKPPREIAEAIAPWIGAAEPYGQVARIWRNDAASGATVRFESSPPRTKRGQLSLIAAAPDLQELPPSAVQTPPSPWINPRWPRHALEPADLAGLRTDAAIVMIQVKGIGIHDGIGITFNRLGPDPTTMPSTVDHATDMVFAGRGWLVPSHDSDMFVFAAPAGRWRVYGLGALPTLNLCLGSPAFDLKAGDVVYAGSFDLGAADIGPSLDLAPARAWFGKSPPPSNLRAASYVNGSLGPCGDNTIYALEVKGAPFEPGYAWGSRAAAAKPAP